VTDKVEEPGVMGGFTQPRPELGRLGVGLGEVKNRKHGCHCRPVLSR